VAADIRTFIPINTKPTQIFQELRFVTRFTAFDIGIFDSKDVYSFFLSREKPIKKRSSGIADVEQSRWRGCKADPNFGRQAQESMLTNRIGRCEW